MKNFLLLMYTRNDNKTGSLNQILITIGAFVFFGLQLTAILYDHQLWNPLNFGIGFSAILGGAGLAHKLTPDSTQPE